MRYIIFKVEPLTLKQRRLGTVDARHQPHALLLAFKQWPSECNWQQGQAGLLAVPDSSRAKSGKL